MTVNAEKVMDVPTREPAATIASSVGMPAAKFSR